MFTVQLEEDATCVFSDSDKKGSYSFQDKLLVFEKPNALFGQSIYFSSTLEPETQGESNDRPRLENGKVHSRVSLCGDDAEDSSVIRGEFSPEETNFGPAGAREEGSLFEIASFSGFLLESASGGVVDEAVLG